MTDAQPPGRPQQEPFVAWCEPGKYAYCRCAQSTRYPYCDGTHRDPQIDATPIKVVFEDARTVAWCACGRSADKPYCDGTHAVSS